MEAQLLELRPTDQTSRTITWVPKMSLRKEISRKPTMPDFCSFFLD